MRFHLLIAASATTLLLAGCATKGDITKSIAPVEERIAATESTTAQQLKAMEAKLAEAETRYQSLIEQNKTQIAEAAAQMQQALAADVKAVQAASSAISANSMTLQALDTELKKLSSDLSALADSLEEKDTNLTASIQREAGSREKALTEVRDEFATRLRDAETNLTKELGRTQKTMTDNTNRMIKALEAQRDALGKASRDLGGIAAETATTVERLGTQP
jgi:chromosome segregation ATPase